MDGARRPRVLIVENDAVVGRMLGDMLHWLGCDPEESLEARDALVRLDGDAEYDLLVTDLQMPEMTGWDLAQTARTWRPQLRVLLITGLPSEAVTERARQARLDLLAKPFTMEALETAVRRALATEVDTAAS